MGRTQLDSEWPAKDPSLSIRILTRNLISPKSKIINLNTERMSPNNQNTLTTRKARSPLSALLGSEMSVLMLKERPKPKILSRLASQ